MSVPRPPSSAIAFFIALVIDTAAHSQEKPQRDRNRQARCDPGLPVARQATVHAERKRRNTPQRADTNSPQARIPSPSLPSISVPWEARWQTLYADPRGDVTPSADRRSGRGDAGFVSSDCCYKDVTGLKATFLCNEVY
jgi:hypothetical protein